MQPALRTPTIESWSLKVEQQISSNTSVSVGYVGSHGYHELLSVDANLPAATICPAAPCPATYPAGIKVSDDELAAVNITRHEFHGEWNYTISSKQRPLQR